MEYSLCGLFKAIEILDATADIQDRFSSSTARDLINELEILKCDIATLWAETDCPLFLAGGIDDIIQETFFTMMRREEREQEHLSPSWKINP